LIKIAKGSAPPILSKSNSRGVKETNKNNRLYNKGTREFTFKSDIYAATSVKKKLLVKQHKKCCFCEAYVAHISYGDVEHFRPKGGYIQDIDDQLEKPGYYWLAYKWENLFLSCTLCNQRFKKNHFPLEDPTTRCTNHRADTLHESPIFIDLSLEDPEDFIGFREEIAFGKDDGRGSKSIDILGLNRDDLATHRLKFLKTAKRTKNIVKYLESKEDLTDDELSVLDENRAALTEYREEQSEYYSMLKCAGI